MKEIKRALGVLFEPGDVVELRAIGVQGRIHAGYYNDMGKLATDAARITNIADGVYIVLNEINKDLLARSQNRITISPKNLTQDKDIVRRRWLPVDIDAIRPAGISSSDAEHNEALRVAKEIKGYLVVFGFPGNSIITGDSGNGGHLLIRIDLPNNAESENTIKAILKVLAAKYNSSKVSIDPTVYNAARIWKLYGTIARKGDSTSDRPHRVASILEVTNAN